MVTAVSAVTLQVVPVAEAYWTLQPLTLTGLVPRLYSSMKSFVYVALAFPPPP